MLLINNLNTITSTDTSIDKNDEIQNTINLKFVDYCSLISWTFFGLPSF